MAEDGGGKERQKRASSSSGQRSRRPAPAPVAAMDDGGAPMDGDDMAPAAPMPPPPSKGPVAVGRSLELATTPEVCMDTLVDKLKLLDYEREFCRKKKPPRKPLNRLYFALPSQSTNAGEQFFYFTSLTAWLLTCAGNDFPAPKEFDDPNATCSNILGALKRLGFAQPSYHNAKLTVGHGREVCGVLDGLVDLVLEKRGFQVKRPQYQAETFADEAEVDDDAEAAAMEGADEMRGPEPREEEEEEEAYMEPGRQESTVNAAAAPSDLLEKQVLVSKVDPMLWRLELERVAPKLRITLAADSKDWRSHLDETHEHQKTIASAWPDSKASLEKLRGDLTGSLDKLMTREHYLNDQFDSLMQQYRGARQQLGEIQDNYNRRTEAISDRNSELHRISQQLEEIKTMMDERGSNIGDATPVVRIKAAIKKLSEELHDMEVRIGVVSHTLLQLLLKNKRLMQSQAALSDEEDDLS